MFYEKEKGHIHSKFWVFLFYCSEYRKPGDDKRIDKDKQDEIEKEWGKEKAGK